jgi:hypothetical protein
MKARFLIPILMLFAACNTGNVPLTDDIKEAVKAEGASVVNEMITALIENRLDVVLGLMENTPDFSMTIAGDLFDYDGMKDMIDQVGTMVEKQAFETKFEQYVVLDEDCFIYLWLGKNEVFMKTGESVAYDEYAFTYGFRKVEGSWKLFFGHESYKVPLPFDLDEDMEMD